MLECLLGIVQNMDWTGLDWTGLDNWTGPLDWTGLIFFFCNVFLEIFIIFNGNCFERLLFVERQIVFVPQKTIHNSVKIFS